MIILVLAGLLGYYMLVKNPVLPNTDQSWVKHNENHVPGALENIQQNIRRGTNPDFTLRLPFGPNPREYNVQTVDMIHDPTYQMAYKKMLHQVQVKTPNYYIDKQYNTPLNNVTGSNQMSRDDILGSISNFTNKHNLRKPQIVKTQRYVSK